MNFSLLEIGKWGQFMKKFILLLILSLIPALVLAEETVRTWTTSAGKEMVGVMVDGKSYLCPSDTDLENRDSIVSRDWAFEQLEKCAARQKIFIVDACRDEVLFGGAKALGDARALEDPIGAKTHGFILIASCDREQQSWEDETLEHGVFTHFLAEGLAGAAGDEEGYVSIMDLFQYASRQTKKHVFREFNRVQVPTFRQGSEMTDFILAKLESDFSSVPPTVSGPVTPPEPPKPAVRKAGERMVKTVDGIEYAFRWCPPGTFMMGEGKESHEVTLTHGFWMLETQVTQKMWKSVMRGNPSRFPGEQNPVECVSWDDCQEFCRVLSSKISGKVDLPTEAQWEYACRAGTTGDYAGELGKMAWYDANSRSTHPVRQKQPNAWGLYDMHGNVREWCSDWYAPYMNASASDPTGPDLGTSRVVRGGGWQYDEGFCRSAYRHCHASGEVYRDLGFRCVLALPVK